MVVASSYDAARTRSYLFRLWTGSFSAQDALPQARRDCLVVAAVRGEVGPDLRESSRNLRASSSSARLSARPHHLIQADHHSPNSVTMGPSSHAGGTTTVRPTHIEMPLRPSSHALVPPPVPAHSAPGGGTPTSPELSGGTPESPSPSPGGMRGLDTTPLSSESPTSPGGTPVSTVVPTVAESVGSAVRELEPSGGVTNEQLQSQTENWRASWARRRDKAPARILTAN